MIGKMFKLWQVFCASCGMRSPAIDEHYQAGAASRLRKYGWGLRDNLWRCNGCHAKEVSRA